MEAQYRIFAERYRGTTDLGTSGQSVNRFILELLFQERDLVPARHAGAQMGMSLENFRQVLDLSSQEGLIHRPSVEIYSGVVSRNLVSTFHKNFEGLRNAMFGSHSSYIQRLHESISQTLGLGGITLFCETSRLLQDDPLIPAYNIDILTDEPMAICYQVYLEGGKPGSLSPDACSWKTFVSRETLVNAFAMGRTTDRMGEVYTRLRHALGA